MAEILVSALLRTVLGNFNSASIQEIGLAWGFEKDLNNLKKTFVTIKILLQDAEMKQRKNLTLQNWLRNLKNAAYDADNILDQIATEGLKRRMESERGNHHKLKAFISKRNPLIFRLKIARNVQNVRKRLDMMLDEGFKLGLTSVAIMENQNGDALEDRQTSSLVNESEIYGRKEEKEMVIKNLLGYVHNQDDFSVYAICGMGGIGKTTLAQLVYNDERVDKHFELRIWVCVSVDFSVPRLVRAIIESIEGGGCNISELDPLMHRLQERLRGRKFLLVLDDVWNENNNRLWDELKEALRCGSKGSVLLVTTRIEKVALMMTAFDIYHLRYLSEEESWSLFRKRAFATGEADENLEEIGKEIVRKCGGLPLAVKALGSLMRYKSSASKWFAIEQSEIWNLSDGDNGILPALRLSYDNLSPQMRQCFTYCCIFPKDKVMKVDKLIKLWMANGFIQGEGPTDMRLAGHLIFKELVWKSFFQEVQKNYAGKMVCKIHDLMHDLAESVMRNEAIRVNMNSELNIPKGVHHLSILDSLPYWGNKDKFKFSTDGSLRTILVRHKSELPRDFDSFVCKQKYLRVFDMSFRRRPLFPAHKMEHLRYLVLSCNIFEKIPESITCLQNLQTLKLKTSYYLLELPKGLRYMKSLYFLHIRNCESLLCTPPGLGELTCLQKLSIFIVGQDLDHEIGQLKDLNLGGKLCIKGLGCIRDFNDAKSANLVSKKNLTCLSLSWEKVIEQNTAEHYEQVLEGLQPNQNLEEINIRTYPGSKFPNWMSTLSFHNLSRITLGRCYRCERLPPLGKLPSLTYLKLFQMNCVKRWESSSFPALKELSIFGMPNLEEWTVPNTIETFPCLEVLEIGSCPKLKELPYLWKVHTSLRKLEIINCPVLEKRYEKQNGEDWTRISHIPEIDIR